MSISMEFSQLSNFSHSKATEYRFLDYSPGENPASAGDDVDSLQTGEAVALRSAGNPKHSAATTFTSHRLGHHSPRSSTRRNTCTVITHAGCDATASSQAMDQRPLVSRQINNSIEPAGTGAILSFGPSKVAKIKADAGASSMARLRVQVAPKARRRRLFLITPANDNRGRMAA